MGAANTGVLSWAGDYETPFDPSTLLVHPYVRATHTQGNGLLVPSVACLSAAARAARPVWQV